MMLQEPLWVQTEQKDRNDRYMMVVDFCWSAPLCHGLPPPHWGNCVTVIPPFVAVSPKCAALEPAGVRSFQAASLTQSADTDTIFTHTLEVQTQGFGLQSNGELILDIRNECKIKIKIKKKEKPCFSRF